MVPKKKQQRPSSRNSKPKMGDKGGKSKEDMISRLPDEVLGSILSLLTLREATRTCVLSHRWERLFTLFNGSLIFDFSADPFTGEEEHRKHERSKYIDWVHNVLTSIDGNINELVLRCYSDALIKCHIDRWVAFAFKKRVQRLELHMRPLGVDQAGGCVPYTFPVEFRAHIKEPSGLCTISCLTSLCLRYVQITGELVEYFLSNCPLLESLCVSHSDQLIDLKVIGAASLRLKFLEISFCYEMESLEISAPNLVSFKYFGHRINLQVENIPKLLELSIGCVGIVSLVHLFSSYFNQIETLTLGIDHKDRKEFSLCLKLTKVKHLTMEFLGCNDKSIRGWTSLISCCPVLHKLTLKTIVMAPRRGKVQKVTRRSHEVLKVVELVGFRGHQNEMEFVMYLLGSSTSLEKIIVNCRRPYFIGTPWEAPACKKSIAEQNTSRGRALQLRKNLPPNVDLVVV